MSFGHKRHFDPALSEDSQIEASVRVELDRTAHLSFDRLDLHRCEILPGVPRQRLPEENAGVTVTLVELQVVPVVDRHEARVQRQQLVRRQEDGGLFLPGSGTVVDVDLTPVRRREANGAIQCGVLESERDAATLPAGSSSHQTPERLGSHHVDQLRRERSLERRLDRRCRGRRAVGFPACGDQGVGGLEQVRLAAAVLADDHVHAAAEAEVRRAEHGQVSDVESPEHSLLRRDASAPFDSVSRKRRDCTGCSTAWPTCTTKTTCTGTSSRRKPVEDLLSGG